jgi:hypothetical protein
MAIKDRKEYDRKHTAAKYQEFKERRKAVFRLLGEKCFVCGIESQKGFDLHHHEYHPEESDYPRDSKTMWTRWKRLMEAEKHPERFRILCKKHHFIVEILKHHDENDHWEKLKDLAKI